MNAYFTQSDWIAIVPLGIVAGTALVVLFADLISRKNAPRLVSIGIGLAGLIAAAVYAGSLYGRSHDAFYGGFILGGFATVFQEIILIGAILSLVLFATLGREDRIAGATALLLWSTAGAMLMAGSANFMTIFLGLELLSLALYCLCGLSPRAPSQESALKYLILSSTASGFLLFGMALLFGASGSVALSALTAAFLTHNPLYWIGGGFFLIGIAFKLSLVPFHVWSPDVYEGAPLPVTAYMSVVTKAATLAVFARFAYAALATSAAHDLLFPFFLLAGISMIVGNLGMLAQTDLKRMLAYSGIAQIGYAIAALAGSTPLGLRYAVYYLAAYTFMNLGAFAVAAILSTDAEEGAQLEFYRGLARKRPWLAAAMSFFLLALAGFPPTAGFLGKILILSATANSVNIWLGALLIAGTAISLYAYFKFIRVMYEPAERVSPAPSAAPLAYLSVAVCLAALLIMTFYPLTPSNILPAVR